MAHLGVLKVMEIDMVTKIFDDLARIIGFPVTEVRFYATILMCYPLALFSRRYVLRSAPTTQHLFYSAAGLSLAYFSFGLDCMHYIVTIFANVLLLQLIGGTRLSVALSLIYNLGYLMVFYFLKTEGFHVLGWDTPQCILCLKMIGLAFDVYDGHKPDKQSLSRDQKETYVPGIPSLLEVTGFTFFFPAMMGGPVFSIRQYLYLTNQQLLPKAEMENPSNLWAAGKRFVYGMIYVALYLAFMPMFSKRYLLSEEFKNSSFLNQVFSIMMWGMFERCMYITAWLMAEGSCILTGLSYNGVDKNGQSRWDRFEIINVWNYETSLTIRELIASYNVQTNLWAKRYIYLRLKFLGSKPVSQFLTLIFLAVWHGPYSGYMHAFVFEFFMLMGEDCLGHFWRTLGFKPLSLSRFSYIITFPFLRILMLLAFSYPFLSFQLLEFSLYNKVFASVGYFGHYVFVLVPVLYVLLFKPACSFVSNLRSGKAKSE